MTYVRSVPKKPAQAAIMVALWVALASLLACAPASSPIAGTDRVTESPSSDTTQVTGRVSLQGRSTVAGVTIEVSRVSDEVRAEPVAQGLEVPWELAFAPDGRIFITERPGRIRVVQDGVLQSRPWATLEQVVTVSESGLMGMALHPDFADNGHLFVCYTYRDGGGDLRNRVARLTDVNGTGAEHQVIFDDMPGSGNHNGCRLGFGPDAKLYVTMGDAEERQQAQNLDSPSGKVLRLEADGSVPPDNPFPGSPVYTYGHRNPQGMAWHPATGDLFITEHGPNEDDEVNILEPGSNYGWPQATGPSSNSQYTDPIVSYTPTIALAGAAFYSGDRLAQAWEANFVFANLKAAQLRRLTLRPPDFRTVGTDQVLFDQEYGRLRAVALSPDGYLYFTTSNRDGRGRPRAGDDRVLRVVPETSGPPAVFQPDNAGEFALDLAPGAHRISWTAPGFLRTGRTVIVSATEELDLGEIQLRAGDVNSSGSIGPDDLALLEAGFDRAVGPASSIDLNGDGVVDILDLVLLAYNWGQTR